MPVVWFLMGLATGLGIWFWRWTRFNARLKLLVKRQQIDPGSSDLDLITQLSHRIADQGQQVNGLERALDSHQFLLENAPIGYLLVNEENQLLWCNLQAGQLLGISQSFDELEQRPRLLLQLVRSYELDNLIEETRQLHQPCQRDWTLYRVSPNPLNPKNEPAYPLRGYGVPLDQGRIGVFLENRQEAVTLLQQRDRWTSDVAHELKTPLTSIRLVAETLKPRIDVALQGWLDRLLNETIRLSNLVEDLLNLSRLEGQNFQGLNLKPVDLAQLITAAWQSLEPLARVKQLSLTYDGPVTLLMTVDESLMYRVLINLLDNAIKHSPSRASVFVQLSLVESSALEGGMAVCLDVIDNGLGFQDKDLPHIFDRFYRADPARKRETNRSARGSSSSQVSANEGLGGGGSGLGLSIVQQIVEAHQGTIAAENHPDLGGGWLKIILPGSLLLAQDSIAGHSPL
ncbi:ATP-binding protein [Pseudanabaena sp. FACHB-2040]|uniref:ATP-binding protein n=1 Tax=Pseudanabaena sp. FACHB-2040 TaxID=2692859 RepID=UPI0016880823|nr:PAS domain-containing protein [Pseudanabaena sp. FACHB-2040]